MMLKQLYFFSFFMIKGCISCSVPSTSNQATGWQKYSDNYYLLVDYLQLSFSNARDYCNQNKAQLAIVYDQDSNDALRSLTGSDVIYIGVTNPSSITCNTSSCSGQKIWQDGSALTYDLSWFKFSFDIRPLGPCGMVNQRHKIFTVSEALCDVKRKFVCQYLCSNNASPCVTPPNLRNGQLQTVQRDQVAKYVFKTSIPVEI